jgi:hypothetical protein
MKALGGTLCVLFALAFASPAGAQDTIIRNFTAGAGPDSVGMVEAGEDTDNDGPQAIYAGERGEIYLLDQLNGRVLQLDPTDPSKAPKVLELPEDMQATDIVVSNDTIYAWDGQIRALQATGDATSPTRSLSLTRSAPPPDDSVASAFAQMGSESVAADEPGLTRSLGNQRQTGRGRQTVSSHGRGVITADVTPFAKDAGVEINIRVKGAASPFTKFKLQVRSRLGDVEVLNIDKQGRVYVLAENIPELGASASTFVARYASAGSLEGIYELPLTSATRRAAPMCSASASGR